MVMCACERECVLPACVLAAGAYLHRVNGDAEEAQADLHAAFE